MSATVTGEYSCSHCTRSWSRMSDLKRHLVTHTGERKFKCSYPGCRSAFGQKSALKPHMNSHFKARPYACGIGECKEHFSDPSSCTRHKKERHRAPDVIYKCQALGGSCGSEIRRRSAFKTHLKKHGIDASNEYLDQCMAKVRPCERKRRRDPTMKILKSEDTTLVFEDEYVAPAIYGEDELYTMPQPYYHHDQYLNSFTPDVNMYSNSPALYANSPLSYTSADSPLSYTGLESPYTYGSPALYESNALPSYVPTPTSTPSIIDFNTTHMTTYNLQPEYTEENYASCSNDQYYTPAPELYSAYPAESSWMTHTPGGIF